MRSQASTWAHADVASKRATNHVLISVAIASLRNRMITYQKAASDAGSRHQTRAVQDCRSAVRNRGDFLFAGQRILALADFPARLLPRTFRSEQDQEPAGARTARTHHRSRRAHHRGTLSVVHDS